MPLPFPLAGKFPPAFFLTLVILFSAFSVSLAAQETLGEEEDFYDDDFPVIESEGLTITATPETTQQMKVLTKEEIEKLHAPDLAVLLRTALDMGVTRYGSYGSQTDINMRGFDSERIAFLIDGIPANSPQSGEFELSRIDLNTVERIEVIYGGSDTKYNVSGALGGVINIITVKKQKPGFRFNGSLSNTSYMPGTYTGWEGGSGGPKWQDLLDTQNIAFSAGLGTEKNSFTAGLFTNRAGNHFLYTNDFEIIRRKEKNEVWDGGASASWIRDIGDYIKLIVKGDAYYGDRNIPISGDTDINGKQKDFSAGQSLMLDMPLVFREDLAAEASLSHSWQNIDYERPGSASRHGQYSLTAINHWSWYPFTELTFRLGGDYRYVNLDSTDQGRHNRHDGGVYLTTEYQPVKQFLIIPSIKTVFSGSAALPVVPVPKLGLVWHIGEAVTVKNNYFRSFKNPDLEDLYWSDGFSTGDPNLKPEDGWGADLGFAWRLAEWLGLESALYSQWTRDSIHWYPAGTTWKPQNVGEAIFFGWDSRARFDIPVSLGLIKKIALSFSYHWILSYLLSYGYTWASDKRIPYMPAHTIGASADISWETGSFLVSGHFESSRYTETANISKLDPCFLLDFTVNQKIGSRLTAFGVIRNALNVSYESFSDYPMPGITITAGMRINFEIPGKNNK
jgi:vitamin B12 transporter